MWELTGVRPGTRRLLPLACVFALCAFGASAGADEYEVRVRASATADDDYITWVPVRCTIAVSGAQADETVKLRGKTGPSAEATGEVQFQDGANTINRSAFAPVDELTLTVPQDGSPVSFFVAGKRASTDGKDVSIVVTKADGTVLHEHPVMVRIRKNAEKLKEIEIERFLAALAKLHDLEANAADSRFIKYVRSHALPFGDLHGNPAFPPWHRVFILSLERELQAIDPRVALPYWRFDRPAPKLFSPDFLGSVDESLPFSDPNRTIVQFSSTSPLNGWGMPDVAGNLIPMRRSRNASQAGSLPSVDLPGVLGEPTFSDFWDPLEFNYHNTAHSHVGGWLVTAASPRDPLFFLLHANVDRAWAEWQEKDAANRFSVAPDGAPANHAAREAYEPIDEYPGPPDTARLHDGHYLRDDMWPWNEDDGSGTPDDMRDNWPTFPAGAFLMPPVFPGQPSTVPHIMDTIDYMGVRDASTSLDFAYDDLPYKP